MRELTHAFAVGEALKLFNNLQPIGVGARCGPWCFPGNWGRWGSKTNEVLTLEEKLVSGLKGSGMRFNVSMSLSFDRSN